MSARAAYTLARRLLDRGGIEACAELAELLREQRELLRSRYLRHNLGERKSAKLDELAAALGLTPPQAG